MRPLFFYGIMKIPPDIGGIKKKDEEFCMKKRLLIPVLLIAAVLCLLLFSSCGGGGDGKEKLMTLSLNPEIELILDGENRVLYANAQNDEGNAVVANVEFKGKSAEEAATLFLDFCHRNGFDRNADGEAELEIELSGDSAEEIYRSVKKAAEEKIASLGASIEVELDEVLTKQDLCELVSDCMRELSAPEINVLTEEELIALLKESRAETEAFLSEELKEFYYSDRTLAIQQAELSVYFEIVESDPNLPASTPLTPIRNRIEAVAEEHEKFREAYQEAFLSEDSPYRQKMDELIRAKKALLSARLAEMPKEELYAFKTDLAAAERAFEAAKEAAEATLLVIENSLQLSMNNARVVLESLVEKTAAIESEIKIEADAAKRGFKAEFIAVNQTYIDSYWVGFNVAAR